MKLKLLTVAAAMAFSLNSQAWVGTGSDHVEKAREYMRFAGENGNGSDYDNSDLNFWVAAVAGLSDGFNNPALYSAICYPEGTTGGTLYELAAKYVINNPEERHRQLGSLVWDAHQDAYGLMGARTCWAQDLWAEWHE